MKQHWLCTLAFWVDNRIDCKNKSQDLRKRGRKLCGITSSGLWRRETVSGQKLNPQKENHLGWGNSRMHRKEELKVNPNGASLKEWLH